MVKSLDLQGSSGIMSVTPKSRLSELDFIARLNALLQAGEFKAGTAYSAEEVADKMKCATAMVKRFLPIIVAARALPGKLEWEKRMVGSGVRYTLTLRAETK